jgi:adenylosuccinate lyase
MLENLDSTGGVYFSQRVLLALVENGISRNEAYAIVHRLSMTSWNDGRKLLDLVNLDPDVIKVLSKQEINKLFDITYYVRHLDEIFERFDLV